MAFDLPARMEGIRQERSAVPSETRPFRVLLIDDNPGDRMLFRLTFRELEAPVNLHEAGNGQEALDFLSRRGDHVHSPPPDLILLDLSMPGIDGHEVLRHVKGHATLRRIPVLVISSTMDPLDVERCYDAGANSMIVKPLDYEGFLQICESIHHLWMNTAVLAGSRPPLFRSRLRRAPEDAHRRPERRRRSFRPSTAP